MEKNRMYRAVVVQNGQYGFVHKEDEKIVLDHPFKTYEYAAAALNRRYRMEIGAKDPDMKPEKLSGNPEDFTVTVNKGDRVNFTDHYFIEEV